LREESALPNSRESLGTKTGVVLRSKKAGKTFLAQRGMSPHITVMTDSPKRPPFEEIQIRCPRLGGPVSFEYCRVEDRQRPCTRAVVCWSVHFDAESFFRETMTPEDFEERFHNAPPSKIITLVDLIEQARKTMEKPNKD